MQTTQTKHPNIASFTTRKRLVIIEDNTIFKHYLSRVIEEKYSYEIYQFDGLSDFIQNFNQVADILIIDHHLNGNQGFDLIPQLKEKFPNCIIIYMTSSTNIEVMLSAKRSGAQYFVKKDTHITKHIFSILNNEQIKSSTSKKRKPIRLFKKRKKTIHFFSSDELQRSFIPYRLKKLSVPRIHILDNITSDSISTVAQDELVILYFKNNLIEINSGIEILKRKNKDQKIIILSTLRSMDTALELFNKGISDYILMDSEWESNIKAELIKHSIYCYSRKKIE